jgi:hypothetical protein
MTLEVRLLPKVKLRLISDRGFGALADEEAFDPHNYQGYYANDNKILQHPKETKGQAEPKTLITWAMTLTAGATALRKSVLSSAIGLIPTVADHSVGLHKLILTIRRQAVGRAGIHDPHRHAHHQQRRRQNHPHTTTQYKQSFHR